jgi:hypothetical protein
VRPFYLHDLPVDIIIVIKDRATVWKGEGAGENTDLCALEGELFFEAFLAFGSDAAS